MKRRLKIMPEEKEDSENNIQGPSLENQMKRIILFAILILLTAPSLIFAQSEKKKALYFYAENCSLCDEVDEYFSSQKLYDKYDIEKIEVAGPYNMSYLDEFFDVFGVNNEKRGWPAVVFGNEMLIGSQSIMDKFSREMEKFGNFEKPVPLEIKKNFEQKENLKVEMAEPPKAVSFLMVSGAAFVDSTSPCSLAAVVILFSLLLFARREKKVFLAGAFFILGVFTAYFMIGFSSVGFSQKILFFSKPISITMGIIAILIGLFNIRYLLNLGKLSLNIFPASFGKKINSPVGALILGFFASLFLAPCANRPYLATVKILMAESYSARSIFFLFFYNLIFIIPAIGSMLIVYFGVRSRRVREWRSKKELLTKTKLIYVIIGAVMIFTGVYLIQNWI